MMRLVYLISLEVNFAIHIRKRNFKVSCSLYSQGTSLHSFFLISCLVLNCGNSNCNFGLASVRAAYWGQPDCFISGHTAQNSFKLELRITVLWVCITEELLTAVAFKLVSKFKNFCLQI